MPDRINQPNQLTEQTQSNQTQRDTNQDPTQQDQDGDNTPRESTLRKHCSSDSLLSSPLGGLDEKKREAAKASWQPTYDGRDEERAQASGSGDAAQATGVVEKEGRDGEAMKLDEESPLFDAAKGEVDPHDEYVDFRKPPAESKFLKLTASPRKKSASSSGAKKEVVAVNGTEESLKAAERPEQPTPNSQLEPIPEDEIIDSYATTTSVFHSTIIYTIRHKLSRALILSRRIYGDPDPDKISHEIATFLMDACSTDQEAKDALYAEQKFVAPLVGWQLGPEMLYAVSEAIALWELVDEGKAQGLGSLRGKMGVVEMERNERKADGGGGGDGEEGRCGGCLEEMKKYCSSQQMKGRWVVVKEFRMGSV